jgi:hypothetical protein
MNQLINVHFHLEWETDMGEKSGDWKIPLRYFFRYELEHLLERSLFEGYTILGDFQGNELNPDSKEFIVECRKK